MTSETHVDYAIDQTYGIYYIGHTDPAEPAEDWTFDEMSRVTPKGWTADSDAYNILRVYEECEEVTAGELGVEFEHHEVRVIPPEDVPGEIKRNEPPENAADIGYEFAIRPDERDSLEPKKPDEDITV
jgi:hypothetical protein